MTFDLHTHHNRCGHAHGSIRDYIEAAVDKGMSYIGISDHTPLFAEKDDHPSPEACMAKSEFPAYIGEVLALKKEYEGRIDVLLGIEADFLPDCLHTYERIFKSYPFDYVIGSVHEFAGISLYDTLYWEQLSPEGRRELKESYYDYIAKSAASGLYDVLGHVDALNRYFPGYSRLRTEAADHTLKTIAAYNIAIEINSSDELWVPDGWLLERALHYGVSVTFGSDAHEPARVGEYADDIRKHLIDIGYREWAVFKNRERILLPL